MTDFPVAIVLGWLFLGAGSAFVLAGGIGILRLPDFYTRIHAAGITDTMGAWLIVVGLMFSAGWTLITAKLLMLLVFLVITSPAGEPCSGEGGLRARSETDDRPRADSGERG